VEYANQILDNIYMQKTCYNINTQSDIEQNSEIVEKPMSLLQSISNFESGKVYEVKHKNCHILSKSDSYHKKLLIYIITKQVRIDDEIHIITFFKDITFGILYE
jgi:hypothetical protein